MGRAVVLWGPAAHPHPSMQLRRSTKKHVFSVLCLWTPQHILYRRPTTPTGGGGGSEGGGGGPGSEAGTAPLSRAASAARPSEDDGMEEIGGVQRSGSGAGASEDGAGGGDANARAAARAARRQASRRLGY